MLEFSLEDGKVVKNNERRYRMIEAADIGREDLEFYADHYAARKEAEVIHRECFCPFSVKSTNRFETRPKSAEKVKGRLLAKTE